MKLLLASLAGGKGVETRFPLSLSHGLLQGQFLPPTIDRRS